MISDVARPPFCAVLGLMGWPWPGVGGTIWRDLAITEGLIPTPEVVSHMKQNVLANVREGFPKLAPWVDSMEWLQERGRGDLVGVADLRTGAVLFHTCIAWREDYRDEKNLLWNWEWVICTTDPHNPKALIETRADASGAILDNKGRYTQKVLVRPTAMGDEALAAMGEWHRTVAPMLAQSPPVRTWPVDYAPLDVDAYEAECRRVVEECLK